MKILTSILLFLTGVAAIAYSYIGSMVTLAGDVDRLAQEGDGVLAVFKIFDFILAGEIPQMTGFLYGGALLIAVSVVMLIVRRKTNDE